MHSQKSEMGRVLKYPEAINEALHQEMDRDDRVIVMGQGVDDPKAILGTTKGLVKKFGSLRVFDTPIAEDGMTGVAVGTAMAGLRPVHIHIRMDFVLLAFNQLINMAAKMRYMFAGAYSVPMVMRCFIGKSWGQGPQHSQSLYPLLMNIPGLKIFAPSTPYDAKGCLIKAIRDDNPVIFVEHRLLYYQKGYVPVQSYEIDFGRARVMRQGKDITLVGISQMAIECLRSSSLLNEEGISAEVIDPVSLNPLDIKTISDSVKKTGRLVVVDNAWMNCGAGAEIVMRLIEQDGMPCFQVSRMGFADVPCPTTPTLEQYFYPDAKKIASRSYSMLYPDKKEWVSAKTLVKEEVEFKGPF